MVRAILACTKTQTRRVCKGARELSCKSDWQLDRCPYGGPGDQVWVKETFFIDHFQYLGALKGLQPVDKEHIYYAADGDICSQVPECDCSDGQPTLKPSIFMPRWASRLTLEIVKVRVERLQDITAGDCIAEGIVPPWKEPALGSEVTKRDTLRQLYAELWQKINGKKHPWSSNPFVWVIEFSVLPNPAAHQNALSGARIET